MESKIKKMSVAAIIAIVCLPLGYKLMKWSYYTPRWQAVFYTFANSGQSPVLRGPFMSEEDCLRTGKDLMTTKQILIANSLEPATFFCGKDCSSDAFDRDGLVFDISCSEGNPPSPPEN